MGVGDAIADGKLMDQAVEELADDRRPEAGRHARAQVDRELQAPRGHGDRLPRHAARRPDVRVPRPAHEPGAAPRRATSAGSRPRAFDGRGNYTLGIRDQLIFPEINYAKVQKVKGMNVCIVTTARTDEEAKALLAGLGMPFRKN